MSTDHDILAGIEEIARVHLGLDQALEPEASLVEDLELDSIRRLTLAVEVENRFRIVLQPEDEAEIHTVRDLVTTIAAKLDRAEPAAEGQ